jgi:hypothetical protein
MSLNALEGMGMGMVLVKRCDGSCRMCWGERSCVCNNLCVHMNFSVSDVNLFSNILFFFVWISGYNVEERAMQVVS